MNALIAVLLAATAGHGIADGGANGGVAPTWPEVTQTAKPWAYNWWMASAVDREGLEAQCAAMEEAGLGGFHVIPIYGARGYEAKYLKYLSPEWMRAFKDAVEIGAKHGLGVDMTMGNGWCFGGPQLRPEQGCWKLEKTPDGRAPYVTWSLTGQKVKRAGPGGQGPMMDPYSTEAIEAFMAPYSVFDDPGAAKPLHVYHDSWEYFQAGWSPALFDAFKAKRGYDLRDHLKELAGIGGREEVGRVRCDYRVELEAYESGFLVVKGGGSRSRPVTSGQEFASPLLELVGSWTLTPVCGGPELPPVRTMERLTTWSRNADGSENPFSGTMRYTATFNLVSSPSSSTCLLDLGSVSQSARVRINGTDVGFAIMAPYRVEFSASLLRTGTNELEIEVTSTGANRIRWNDRQGVNWKYFTDANLVAYGYKGQLDAAKWPLAEYGLLGPVRLCGVMSPAGRGRGVRPARRSAVRVSGGARPPARGKVKGRPRPASAGCW